MEIKQQKLLHSSSNIEVSFISPLAAGSLLFLTILLLLISSSCQGNHSNILSTDFYSTTCPNVESLVRANVRSASSFDSSVPGKLLRLVFHDCVVEGCDGSVLVEGDGTERSDPANKSLGGFEVIETAKRLLELLCPGTVSCADILVLAARDAVAITGGPSVAVLLGRRDGRVSSASNVRPNMVDTSFSVENMAQRFTSKGLSLDDLVVLSGAHTIGLAHCSSFRERFQVRPDGQLQSVDTSLDKNYALELSMRCNGSTDNGNVTISNDSVTPFLFDNQYYINLLKRKGLFRSDSVLGSDPRTKAKVEQLAGDQDLFFNSWAEAFLRMTGIEVKTGAEGEIRATCGSVNT